MIRHIAFGCAVLSLLVLAGATIAGGLASPGYDHLTRYISELGATGAPTSRSVSLAFMVSGGLLALFWLLCAGLFPRSLLSIPGFGLSALNGVGLLLGGVFRCDFECSVVDPSLDAILHEVFGGVGYMCGIVGVFLVGAAARNWPQGRGLFRLSLICGIPAALAIWLIHPAFEWLGAAQRVVEIALAVWALAVAMRLRAPVRLQTGATA
ncbi:MAG: DUF998 domain-containing protein [Phenylobacterium sp.]|uniref:DUF998 domain-containing protein n=1 Tax=Brevundimonas sp. TaxID=1871086 RepID=UPI00273801D9|nr:DUF998 domain-containing protein [Brevundimonas sp.]MDP3801021.1 DUF998 domain-containing protein [Brevundimonas sp.]MDZ4372298.1 DUF998 domain-containing protein [Phenylobacterium sp.]